MTNSYPYAYPDSFYSTNHNSGLNQHNHWPNSNTTPSYISSAAMNAINPSLNTNSSALTTLTNISAAVAAQNPLLNASAASANTSLSNGNCLNNTNGTMNSSNLSGFNVLGSTNNSSNNNLIQNTSTDNKPLLPNFNPHTRRKRRILFTQPQVGFINRKKIIFLNFIIFILN